MRRKRVWMVALVLALALAGVVAQPTYADDITVDTTNDVLDAAGSCSAVTVASLPGSDGVISLREAICAANNNSGSDTIEFNILGCGGVCTIQPTSALPTLSDDDTTIDGYSQISAGPGFLQIEIDGSGAGSAYGFTITSAGNMIRGLVINRFSRSGIRIYGSGATSNTISGNYIGTDASGADLGNGWDGVYIHSGAQNNTVGGDTDGERNVISGNDMYGVYITGSGTMSNTVSRNYIGIAANSVDDLGNTLNGVRISGGAQNNTVGGDTDGERNVISGNDVVGVYIHGSGTTGNTISGNYIGTTASGGTDRGNTQNGVYIGGGAQNNTVGGATAGERNVISGNDMYGVYIEGSDTTGNIVSGNYIGTDASGMGDLGNTRNGVYISGGAQNNTVGGATDGERNVISANDQSGVRIAGSGTTGNTVSGNYIGTDANGTNDLGNSEYGVYISGSAQNNTVGGDTDGERNVISGNDASGVRISGSDTMSNTVSGNYIGTDAGGTNERGNTLNGVYISGSAQNNTIGGTTAGERNVISGNDRHGVQIYGGGTTGNTISGNYIGTDESGTAERGNTLNGVYISGGAQSNTVGGATTGERNVISGNDSDGVGISGSNGNTVSGNYIGTDVGGTADLGNDDNGVYIYGGAQNNTVGPGNVIAYSGYEGVEVNGGSTTGNVITQNSIFANGLMGIDLTAGANGGIAAPVIVTTTEGSVNVVGTACAGCTVEVFENSNADGEGETYVGDTTATASGAFTVTVSSLSKPYLTATATDATDGTSEFSAVFTATVSVDRNVYLPVILKNH